MSTIPAALDIAEDWLLPALQALTVAAWGALPPGTVGRLLAPHADPTRLDYALVAQHQDGGGAFAPLVGSVGWAGEVAVRCLAATDARARAGRDAARLAALGRAAPAGYAVQVRELPPIALPSPDPDGIYQRAWRCVVTLRRSA